MHPPFGQTIDQKPRISGQSMVSGASRAPNAGSSSMASKLAPAPATGEDFIMQGTASPPLAAISGPGGMDAGVAPVSTTNGAAAAAAGGQAKVPAFLNKLFRCVPAVSCSNLRR